MEWGLHNKRFVAFLDIAGFKAMVRNEKTSKIAAILSEFKLLADKQCKEYGYPFMLYSIAISDSIIIISKDDSEESFSCFCQSLGIVFNNTLTFKLITCAVAFGEMYVDRENMIFFGEPYNIAYTLQDNMNYYGVLCDESVSRYIKEKKLVTQSNHFNFYKKLFIKLPSSVKKTKIHESPIHYNTQDMLNFKWFDPHFDPVKRFVEQDGMLVGTYYERVVQLFDKERLKQVSYSEEKSKIEERINNTIEIVNIFSKSCAYFKTE